MFKPVPSCHPLLLLGALLPGLACAADGVIEINQAVINASGAHTYTISQPGSYRLTSDLNQFDANTDLIVIASDDVSLDLNGFALLGANTCSLPPTTCTGNGTGNGITSTIPRLSVGVKNGSIRGMGGKGLSVKGSGIRLENLSVSHSGDIGIDVGQGSHTRLTAQFNRFEGIFAFGATLSHSQAQWNGGPGMRLSGSTVKASVAQHNGDDGVAVDRSGSVLDSLVQDNGGNGIRTVSPDVQVVIARNEISGNLGHGVVATSSNKAGAVVEHNTVMNNGGRGLLLASGAVIGNLIHWNGNVGLEATYAVSMRDNNFQGNNGGAAQTAGSVLFNASGNLCGPVAC